MSETLNGYYPLMDGDGARREPVDACQPSLFSDADIDVPRTVAQDMARGATTHAYLPYVAGSDTSKAAADAFDLDALAAQERRVYDHIVASGTGATCDEIEIDLTLKHQAASARIRGLVLRGLVRDSGCRKTTSSNRTAVLWCAARRRA